MSLKHFWIFSLLSLSWVQPGLPQSGDPPWPTRTPADVYLDYSLRLLAQTEAALPTVTQAAEAVADRLLAGGKLYIGGSQQAFGTEGHYRAGGLMLLQYYQNEAPLKEPDTILIGSVNHWPEADIKLVRTLQPRGVKTVVFGSPQAVQLPQRADFFLSNWAPTGEGLIQLPGWDEEVGPIAPVMNVANLWVFTAELVAALTRRQAMPTMFQSVMVEGAQERNAKYLPEPFHTDLQVDPVAPGVLGKQYLGALRQYLKGLQTTQRAALQTAAQKVVQARAAGHTAHAVLVGHYPPAEIGRPGDPGIFQPAKAKGHPEEPLEGIQAGDVIFYVGYTWLPEALLRGAKEAGATTLAAIATGEGWEVPSDLVDVFIDPQWKFGDAAVEVPGYDIPILPPSGVVQSIVYWCVAVDAAWRETGTQKP